VGDCSTAGPLEGFLDHGESPTAEELRGHVRWEREMPVTAAAGA
jgi:hypothetical protein